MSLLQKLNLEGEVKSEVKVKVERREKHQSSSDLTDILEGVEIAKWAVDDMNKMMTS